MHASNRSLNPKLSLWCRGHFAPAVSLHVHSHSHGITFLYKHYGMLDNSRHECFLKSCTSAPRGICCTARMTANLPSNIKTEFGKQLQYQFHLAYQQEDNEIQNISMHRSSYLWLIMEITGYNPVPKGLSSLSQMVCALHANCIE